jgi:nucleoside-diphosphate-sugar epimerase
MVGLIKGADVVLHFAGIAPLPECQAAPSVAYDNNVVGTINILEACREAGTPKIIFASTSAVYENCTKFPSIEDEVEKEPNLIYSMTKRNCEMICNSYVDNYNMDITTLRLFNVYGPHQDFKRKHPPLMGYITKCLLQKNSPNFFSDGHQKRDYVHIDDVSKMIEFIIDSDATVGQVLNVCSGKTYSVREIYNMYQEAFNVYIEPSYSPPEKFWNKYPQLFEHPHSLLQQRIIKEVNKYSLGSCDKARLALGWSPKIDMKAGIQTCVDFAKKC